MIEFATVARPYAKALFELADEKKQLANWSQWLVELVWLVQQEKIAALIEQVDVSAAQKANELIQILESSGDSKSEEFRNFIRILAEEKRLVVLPEISKQYQDLVLAKEHIKQATIYTAYEIADEAQKSQIIQDLEQRFNTRLQAEFQIEPELIGGVKVEIGDQVLDLSVQGKLQKLYATMIN